jgi:hypothetical protein
MRTYVQSPKTFRRLLRGTGAEEVVPLLLAARDAYLEEAAATTEPPSPVPSMQPGHACIVSLNDFLSAERDQQNVHPQAVPESHLCPICFEQYAAPGTLPRMLVNCGHTFCEPCLRKMLAPLLANKGAKVRSNRISLSSYKQTGVV